MRLGSALAGTFFRQVREPGGGGGWYILCPEGTKLVRAMCPGVPARAHSRPVAAASSGRRPGRRAPASLITRSPLSRNRRTARFCFGLAPSRWVLPDAPCSARLDTTPLRAREPNDRLGGTSLPQWRHSVPGPRVTRGRRPGPFTRSGRCKSNGTKHLHGPVRRIRSSACRLRIPRPVRRPSLGPRGETLRASGSGNDRLSDSLVSVPLAIPNVRLKGGAVYERSTP